MKHKLEYGAVRLFIFLVRLLPRSWGIGLGSLVGLLFYGIDRKHREYAQDHLMQAFGLTKDGKTIRKIVENIYRHMGKSLAEAVYLPYQTASAMRSWVRTEGLAHYTEAIRQGRGAILLTAHFGNWEMIPKMFWAHGFRIHGVVRPLDNPYLDRMVYTWRTQNGMGVVNKRADVSQIMKLLRAGEIVGFLLDQNTVEKEAVFVDFFGRPAATHKGVAVLALRSKAPVLPVFMIRDGNGHRMIIEKPLSLLDNGSYDEKITRATALFTKTIESYIARYPDQWLWIHRRWKTQQSHVPGV